MAGLTRFGPTSSASSKPTTTRSSGYCNGFTFCRSTSRRAWSNSSSAFMTWKTASETPTYTWSTAMTELNQMTFDEFTPSNSRFLSKSDVGESGLALTIDRFKREEIQTDDDDWEEKSLVYFKEHEKPLILNRTNSQLISVATGARTLADAIGRRVLVYTDPTVAYAGRIVGGLRIRKLQDAAP